MDGKTKGFGLLGLYQLVGTLCIGLLSVMGEIHVYLGNNGLGLAIRVYNEQL